MAAEIALLTHACEQCGNETDEPQIWNDLRKGFICYECDAFSLVEKYKLTNDDIEVCDEIIDSIMEHTAIPQAYAFVMAVNMYVKIKDNFHVIRKNKES